MKPPEEVKKELVRQWLGKAEQDMKAAEILLDMAPPLCGPSCFHAQQAAEKHLKAFLTRHQIEFPKTHDMEELLALVAQVDKTLSSELRESTALTLYGADIRYPSEPDPVLHEAREAVELARQVRDAVRKRLGGHQDGESGHVA